VLYVNFIEAMSHNGCVFYSDLYDDLIGLDPLISVFGINEPNTDFGAVFNGNYYGNLRLFQTSGKFFTITNNPGVASIEAILKEQPNATASITPCKSCFRRPHLTSPPHYLTFFRSHWKLDRVCSDLRFQGLSGDLRWNFGDTLFPACFLWFP